MEGSGMFLSSTIAITTSTITTTITTAAAIIDDTYDLLYCHERIVLLLLSLRGCTVPSLQLALCSLGLAWSRAARLFVFWSLV